MALAIKLIEIALPAWETHVTEHPADLERVNKLITKEHYVQGGAHEVVKVLPRVAVLELKQTIKEGTNLKGNSILQGQLAKIMEPLTIATWDAIMPSPARLAFTAVFNLLTFLLFRRMTPNNETHVYVAINQACDAILQKQFLSLNELEELLKQYEHVQAPPLIGNVTDAPGQPAASPSRSGGNMFASSLRKNSAHCPRCGSRAVSEEAVGIEFTRMRCSACGNDDTCDVWQLDEWYG